MLRLTGTVHFYRANVDRPALSILAAYLHDSRRGGSVPTAVAEVATRAVLAAADRGEADPLRGRATGWDQEPWFWEWNPDPTEADLTDGCRPDSDSKLRRRALPDGGRNG